MSGYQKCLTRGFGFTGDDVLYKVGVSAPQAGHQLTHILLWNHVNIWLKIHYFCTFIFIDIIIMVHDTVLISMISIQIEFADISGNIYFPYLCAL